MVCLEDAGERKDNLNEITPNTKMETWPINSVATVDDCCRIFTDRAD